MSESFHDHMVFTVSNLGRGGGFRLNEELSSYLINGSRYCKEILQQQRNLELLSSGGSLPLML